MTALLPPQVVTAPEPRGVRYGLLAAANGPLDLPTPHGLAGGVTYKPNGCGVAHTYPNQCHTDNSAKTFDDEVGTITRPSFIVYSSLVCGAAGTTPAGVEERVRRRLSDGEQTAVEEGFADVLDAGATLVHPPFHDEFLSAVGALEQWLYATPTHGGAGYGYVGYLHAPHRYAALATYNQLIVKDGPILRTPTGTIWVFGGGYPDDGSLYITGQVTVWRSRDPFVSPAAQVLDRTTNQYRLIAEREYAVSYDCVAAKAIFDWVPAS